MGGGAGRDTRWSKPGHDIHQSILLTRIQNMALCISRVAGICSLTVCTDRKGIDNDVHGIIAQ